MYRLNDAITSLSLGVLSQTHKLVVFTFATLVYAWFANKLAISSLPEDSLWTWVFAFILYDFLYYWYHRFSHQVNFLWAAHVVHHQSEEYNLTTALRQTSSSVGAWVFYIPSFLIGIPAEVFFVSGALNLVYQFWVHTRLIGKLGWFEKVFVTPSHHRVHHGQNDAYIDKNHGGVFIIWDKLFGTFQQELDDEPVIYGVRRAVGSFNPFWANLHTWWSLAQDAWRTARWQDKLKIWFMPTGWRPNDVSTSYPINKVNPHSLVKYDPSNNPETKIYVLVQFALTLLCSVFFILYRAEFTALQLWLTWLVISLPLFSLGLFLESKSWAFPFEIIRVVVSSAMMLALYAPLSTLVLYSIAGYLVLSLLGLFALRVELFKTRKLV